MSKKENRGEVLYFIEMGLPSACVGLVTIDGKYSLVQVHPPGTGLAIEPLLGVKQPIFEEVVFYANCLTYEHDIPTFIWPVEKNRIPIKPIDKKEEKYSHKEYFRDLGVVYEGLMYIKFGLALVYFRWPGFEKEVNLEYSKKYLSIAKDISLYASAIRQIDPFSEFLNYYRVIESISSDNGKRWITKSLPRIRTYNFGFLEFTSGTPNLNRYRRRRNVFSIYRKRALSRLQQLKSKLKLDNRAIARYLYNENRCGIAHGKAGVKLYDFGYGLETIVRDNYILKLLARIAIEDTTKRKPQ